MYDIDLVPASNLCRNFFLTSESYARSYNYIAFFICRSAVAFVAFPNTRPCRLAVGNNLGDLFFTIEKGYPFIEFFKSHLPFHSFTSLAQAVL